MIRLHQLSKTFHRDGQGVEVLHDVDLEIAEGEVFGIIGRSGAGKSTLVRMFNLLERPDRGSVRIDGDDIIRFDAARLRRWRQRVGMVFQHFNLLYAKTVADNLRFALRLAGGHSPREVEARVDELLELVGLREHRDRYPAPLSGGQKQRVGIARALANRPRLLLCDEATSALDPETTQAILRLLARINQELRLTIVLITHEMDVVRSLCDRVAVLERGRVVEVGEVADVFLFPQHAVTRRLVSESQATAELDPLDLQGPASGGPLLRLTLLDEAATRPVLSQLSTETGVPLNIVRGAVGQLKGRPYGQLLVRLPDAAALAALRPALQRHRVEHELLAVHSRLPADEVAA
ncbi:methionine ABC transporter ATP-binding protein [Caldimonas brevitalea]|uniref:Cell division ATP-binding protein FtsE n=1 Tax=Caldimonas brevitalea TaxID=413882 RepID=A0A0G3BGS3_9BURK|nr:ATP-binding cassette domain-containing protein [Caldimonas brevitalea]AKJ28532.1 methionine ABC transporter ATP-binding protein [Caldimonas brevitalea]